MSLTKILKGPAIGAFQIIADPLVTDLYATPLMFKLGFNAVVIDHQHGLFDEKTAFECLNKLDRHPNCFPIIRVADINASLISRALDAGALGIVAPMINTSKDAERIVRECRYPPMGQRSWGPIRPAAIKDTEVANKTVKVFAMIETRQAVENIESILRTPGLDGIFLGPADLSISLGYQPKGTPTDEAVVQAINKVRESCKANQKLSMLYCSGKERTQSALAEGWDVVFPAADLAWLETAAKEFLK